jgi:mRNA interferase RelE/StbE
MRYGIVLAPEAVEDLSRLPARQRSTVREALEVHLRHEPSRTSRSRVKRLVDIASPQFRLRVGEIRVYYDIVEAQVSVLAIVRTSASKEWLARYGESDETNRSG